MNYLIRLVDNEEFPADQRRLIEQRYDQALVHQLGSPEQVAQARRAWVRAKTREDEATSSDLSLEEKRAIVRWERADVAARLLAFEGYTGALEDIYIEVRVPLAGQDSSPEGRPQAPPGAEPETGDPMPAILVLGQSHPQDADLH